SSVASTVARTSLPTAISTAQAPPGRSGQQSLQRLTSPPRQGGSRESPSPDRGAQGDSTGSHRGAAVVTATAAPPLEIDVTWSDVDSETGYRVERSTDGSSDWTTVATTGQDVTMYSDTGLAAGTTYYYRVYAINAGGDSPPSDVVSATTTVPPPSATTATATAASSSEIDVTWTAEDSTSAYQSPRPIEGRL